VISFNPGPSHLDAATVAEISEIAASGLLSRSHRGPQVIEVVRAAFEGLRRHLALPAEYRVLYQPSATAAMDTILRNCVGRRSFHFVHGAFSKRFRQSAAEIGLDAAACESAWDRAVPWREARVPDGTELVAVTHNETSTGLAWPAAELSALRARDPEPLLAVDVTSSFGAVEMRWTDADLWFGSVQKCLGLPAGMGFLVVSPRALNRARGVAARVSAWQRLETMARKMETWQTVETPNVLAIALLARRMARWDAATIRRDTLEKAALVYGAALPWRPWVADADWRSATVANFVVPEPKRWIARAAEAGFLLGAGYGDLKESCVRIANFPAVDAGAVRALLAAL
jgi:phosphoserine aminotransferase